MVLPGVEVWNKATHWGRKIRWEKICVIFWRLDQGEGLPPVCCSRAGDETGGFGPGGTQGEEKSEGSLPDFLVAC